LFWSFYDRYELAGPVLLQNPEITLGEHIRGNVSEENGVYRLQLSAAGKPAYIRFLLPNALNYKTIRIEARAKTEGVVPRDSVWRCARIVFFQYDQSNHWIPSNHALLTLKGSNDWKFYRQEFEIQPEADHVALVLEQSGSAGIAWYDQIVVEPVVLKKSFVWWQGLFVVSWLVLGTVFYWQFWRRARRFKFLILLNVFALLFGVLMPEQWITASSLWVKQQVKKKQQVVATVSKKSVKKPEKVSDKKPQNFKPRHHTHRVAEKFTQVVEKVHVMGHFLLFASLLFLLYLSAVFEQRRLIYFGATFLNLILFSAVTEALQFLTMDRSPGLGDLKIDFYGMLTGFILFIFSAIIVFRAILRRRGRLSSANQQQNEEGAAE
jgi:VanZ family protein